MVLCALESCDINPRDTSWSAFSYCVHTVQHCLIIIVSLSPVTDSGTVPADLLELQAADMHMYVYVYGVPVHNIVNKPAWYEHLTVDSASLHSLCVL